MVRRKLATVLGMLSVGLSVLGLTVGLGSADADLEDRKLEAFITAAAAVESVMATWQPKIARAADSSETQALRSQANSEIRQSIEEVDGISFAEYREIRQAIAFDPEMRERITMIMRRQH